MGNLTPTHCSFKRNRRRPNLMMSITRQKKEETRLVTSVCNTWFIPRHILYLLLILTKEKYFWLIAVTHYNSDGNKHTSTSQGRLPVCTTPPTCAEEVQAVQAYKATPPTCTEEGQAVQTYKTTPSTCTEEGQALSNKQGYATNMYRGRAGCSNK